MSLEDAKNNFKLVAKRILKSQLSTNPDTLNRYKVDIVNAYNEFIEYVTNEIIHLKNDEEDLKNLYVDNITYIRTRLFECFDKLNFVYVFGDKISERINFNKLINLNPHGGDGQGEGHSYRNSDENSENNRQEDRENNDNNDNNDQDTMAELTAATFLTTYIKLIPQFDGDVDKLQSCIDALNLLHLSVGTYTATAVSMIKSRLTGKARTCLLDSDNTIPLIIERLRNSIKGETSEAIVAKIHNVKQRDKSANKYVKEIEELTESLVNAFITEGLTPNLATKYATQQTVLAMKNNASNEKVKLVMEAGKFEDLNEAVAKFVSTSNDFNPQNPVMYFSQNRNPGRFQGRNFSTYRNSPNVNRNSNNFRGNSFRNPTDGNRAYNNRFNNYSRNNSFNGRGARSYRRGNYNGSTHQNRDLVRYVQNQGNVANPQLVTLGDRANRQQ